jgi:twinkle protein
MNSEVSKQAILEFHEKHGFIEHGKGSDYRIVGNELILQECPLCEKPTNNDASNHFKCYIKFPTGLFNCFRCGEKGNWIQYKQKLAKRHNLPMDYFSKDATKSANPTSLLVSRSRLAISGGNADDEEKEEEEAKVPSRKSGTQKVDPLPMPAPKLQAVYNSQLLDQPPGKDNPILDYLRDQRGLELKTLRKYGIGRAEYEFKNEEKWVKEMCVTFPWIMSVAEVERQETRRGAVFEWKGDGSEHFVTKEETNVERCARVRNMLQSRSTCEIPETATTPAENQVLDENESTNLFTDEETAATDPAPTKQQQEDRKENIFITRRIKARSIRNKGWQRMDPPGGGWGLFGLHTVPRDCKEIVLTEGEFDAMAVWQATGRPAVSLPNGCRSLPDDAAVLLDRFEKIYLWMDNDKAGQEGAKNFAKKIGLNRVFNVRPTVTNTKIDDVKDLPKDANEALLMGCDFELILADARMPEHDQVFHFRDFRRDVLQQIMYPDKHVGRPIKGLTILTDLIGGIRRGELTVLTGATGSGKTTLLGQLSLDLAQQDVKILWGSFEIKNTRLVHKLLQQFHGEPLPTGDPSLRDKLNQIADRFQKLPFYFMKFHGSSDIDEVVDAMEHAVKVHNAECIILDNMQFMISLKNLGMRSTFDKFDFQDLAIEKFREFATVLNVHIVLVVHPRKEQEHNMLSMSSIYGSAKSTQEADTVLILQNDGRRKFLEVKKNRFNGQLGHVPLYFNRHSCRYHQEPQIDHGKKPEQTKAQKPIVKAKPQNVTRRAGGEHWQSFFDDPGPDPEF